jgi:hypothetical protein
MFYILSQHDWLAFLCFRCGSERSADAKEGLLNLFGPSCDLGVGTDAAGETKRGVELVDRAVGLDAQIGL